MPIYQAGAGALLSRLITQRPVLWVALVGLAYFLAHKIAFLIPDAQAILTGLWPAGGIGLAALLLSPRRLWPGVALGLFLAGNTATMLEGRTLTGSLGFMTANIAESLGSAYLITAFCGEGITFGRIREVLALLGATVFVNAGTALIGASVPHLVSTAPFLESWSAWWIADGLGVLLITPLVLSWANQQTPLSGARWLKALEAGIFLVLWCSLAWVSFHPTALPVLALPSYFLVTLLAWPALRYGPRGVSLALILLTVIIISSKSVTTGPILWGGDNTGNRLLVAQVYIAVMTMTGLLLAASYSERVQSETKHRMLFENAGDPVFIHDDQGRMLAVNPQAVLRMGYSYEELMSLTVNQVDTPNESVHIQERIDRLMSQGYLSFESVHRKKDGTRIEVEVNARRVLWDGKPAMMSVCRDITERKKVAEQLRKSEAKLRTIINVSPVPMALNDNHQGVNFLNQTFTKTFGYTLEDIPTLADWWLKAYPDPEYRKWVIDAWQNELERARKTGEDFSPMEVIVKCKDGTNKTVLAEAAPIASFIEGDHLAVLYDITERKRAEEALRDSEARFRSYFDLHLHGIAITSPEKGWLQVNDRISSILGYTREEILQLTWAEITHPDDLAADVGQFERLLAGEIDQYQMEKRFIRKNGSVVCTNLAVGCTRRPDGKVDYIVALIDDITERKQAEEEKERLEAQNWQLQKAESLGRMAGAVAHHFNNQLQAVMGNLELAMLSLPNGTDTNDLLSSAMQAAGRAANVSSLMLTYLGQTIIKRKALNLTEACERNMAMLEALLPKSVKIEVNLSQPGPPVQADIHQLQQVLINLVGNAWEACDDKPGKIVISVGQVSVSEISEQYRFPIEWIPQHEHYACLCVKDNGCGISEGHIEQLFDPFFSSKFTGRGMGLAVVLGIVRTHEAAITVESTPGLGSAFRIYFPMGTAIEQEQPRQPKAVRKESTGITLLVVDDEDMVREVAVTLLTRIGFFVIPARDGQEALQLFLQRRNEISCVLCDVSMPNMDGWSTLSELRKIAPELPVILASGYAEEQVMNEVHADMPDAFLSKPYRIEQLSQAIQNAMAGKTKA